jgi:hypothetical protein
MEIINKNNTLRRFPTARAWFCGLGGQGKRQRLATKESGTLRPGHDSLAFYHPSGYIKNFPYKEIRMAPRQMRMPAKDHADKEAEEMFSQRKRPESGRYLLQVDRQTKGSYKTAQAAQSAGLEIKTGYPIIQVSIYDSVDNSHTLVKLPATSS